MSSAERDPLNTPLASKACVLVREEIDNLCQQTPPLIDPVYPPKVQDRPPASYDLRLGRYARVGKSPFADLNGTDKTLLIPPHEVAYIETEEQLNMPDNLVATFGLRMHWIYRGLIITPQTQIDPGYRGKIFVLLYNLSNTNVYIGRYDHIITIEFRRTAKTSPYIGARQGIYSLPDALIGVPQLESGIAAIARDIHDWKIKTENRIVFMLTIITILLAILTVVPLVKDLLIRQSGTQTAPQSQDTSRSLDTLRDAVPLPDSVALQSGDR